MNTNMAVMFTDLTGSTALYSQLGDHHAQRMITEYLDGLASSVKPYHGHILKWLGDGLMILFPDAPSAAKAAVSMLRNNAYRWGERRLGIRVGFSHGLVMLARDDAHGETVNLAARLVELKQNDAILLDEPTLLLLNPDAFEASFLQQTTLPGFRNPTMIHRLEWRET